MCMGPKTILLIQDIWKGMSKYAGFKVAANNRNTLLIDDALRGPRGVTKTEEDKTHFEEMKSRLPSDEPRFILFDSRFAEPATSEIAGTLIWIFW